MAQLCVATCRGIAASVNLFEARAEPRACYAAQAIQSKEAGIPRVMSETQNEVDWNAVRSAEAFRSARWSAWNSLATALLGLGLSIVAAALHRSSGAESTVLQRVCSGLFLASPLLLVMSVIYGLIALNAVRRFGPGPLLPPAIGGLTISAPICLYGAFVTARFLFWWTTSPGWKS